ncbi:MAG: SufD family Fe-S cluster assembly protein, partial [Corynebacterium variabile]|nr:SufD family Fe-S cluster assembly protein [Corynebacterium variabile]
DNISRADTYPYIDIREDDVTLGHEATVSKVSEDQLFYLMSRGIPDEVARRLIIRGFFSDVIRRVPVEQVRNSLEDVVEQELANTVL